jgi:transcriptional regulator with XRE-family HTH domain
MNAGEIGSELRRQRLLRGWSLAELARRAATSAPTVHRYESGWSRFEVRTLEKLATALGLRLELALRPRAPRTRRESGREVVRRIRRLFWDRELRAGDLERHRTWVVRRVLTLGQLDDVRSLIRYYGRQQFLDIVAGISWDSAGTRAFWQGILEREGRECTTRFSRGEAVVFWTS